ncbi:MAG TPA: LptF/LptG family permease, partial [Chitinophagaceae bacterium]|nr:LptF/LptG family permease [Chitinophagaceae bacterium]
DKIAGFAIKIGKKEPNDSIIRDVIVYEQGNVVQDNFIIAKSGVMRVSDNKRFLEFNLQDGIRYEERTDNIYSNNTEYIRLGFKEYKKQFDLSAFQFVRTDDSVNKNNERVLSMRQLDVAIDSLNRENEVVRTQLNKNIYNSLQFPRFIDSSWGAIAPAKPDTGWRKTAKTFSQWIPDSARLSVAQKATTQVSSLKINLESISTNLKEKERVFRKHQIEWHRKIALSFACLVLFLVGAPLGSIIRKGGLGTPLIFAIIFFMVFYFSSTMGEKFAKENKISPFVGMWMATFILVPIGVFLTYKALRDSQLFNKEFYNRFTRSVRRYLKRPGKSS